MTALAVPDALELCKKMRMNLTQLQGQLTDVMESLAVLPADAAVPKAKCGVCGVLMRGPNALAEHVHLSHGGPVPPGWLRAEEMAGIEPAVAAELVATGQAYWVDKPVAAPTAEEAA